MAIAGIEVEQDRLAWLQQNLLLRVTRSAADGGKVSAWLLTGSSAVFLLALKSQLSGAPGSHPGLPLLSTLWAAVMAAAVGTAYAYFVGEIAVRTFSVGVDGTERIVAALKSEPPDRKEAQAGDNARAQHFWKRFIGPMILCATVSHLCCAGLLGFAGVLVLDRVLVIGSGTTVPQQPTGTAY